MLVEKFINQKYIGKNPVIRRSIRFIVFFCVCIKEINVMIQWIKQLCKYISRYSIYKQLAIAFNWLFFVSTLFLFGISLLLAQLSGFSSFYTAVQYRALVITHCDVFLSTDKIVPINHIWCVGALSTSSWTNRANVWINVSSQRQY